MFTICMHAWCVFDVHKIHACRMCARCSQDAWCVFDVHKMHASVWRAKKLRDFCTHDLRKIVVYVSTNFRVILNVAFKSFFRSYAFRENDLNWILKVTRKLVLTYTTFSLSRGCEITYAQSTYLSRVANHRAIFGRFIARTQWHDQSPKSPIPDSSSMPSNDVSCPYEQL